MIGKRRRWRWLRGHRGPHRGSGWALAAALGAVLGALLALAACAGGRDQEPAGAPTPMAPVFTPMAAPNVRPSPPQEATARASCDALKGARSYRYNVVSKLQIPELVVPTPPASPGAGPLGPITGALAGAPADLRMEGAFVAPDRQELHMSLAGQEMALIAIGNRQWVRLGSLPWQEGVASPQTSFPNPQEICRRLVQGLELKGAGRPEVVNGVRARHYQVDRGGLAILSGLLGSQAPQQLPEEFGLSLWLAEEGLWPVRLDLKARGKDERGRLFAVELLFETRDVNRPDILIQAPVAS